MGTSEKTLLGLAQTQAESLGKPEDRVYRGIGSEAEGPSERPSAPDPQRIGRYIIIRRLGEGSMGVVYAAYDTTLDRKVAIKLVRNSRVGKSQGRSRVLREAQAMAQISHPNVVIVYEVGESLADSPEQVPGDGQILIAMEFVAGMNLHHWQDRAKHSFQEILKMYLQAGEGLWAAHRSGLIHRDFKPDNVLIGDDGRARVADFGLARSLHGAGSLTEADADESSPTTPLSERLTEAGAIMGTPSYMSPEQHRGDAVDARSDQFSFCAALYEVLFSQAFIAGETRAQIAENIRKGKVRAPPATDLPPSLVQALLRGLNFDPAARFPSMRELLDELKATLDPTVDSATSIRARNLFSWSFGASLLLTSTPAIFADASPPIQHIVALPLIVIVILILIVAFNRRKLALNPDTWSLTLLILLLATQLFLARVLAMSMNITSTQYIPVDHVFIFGFAAAIAYRWIPRMWIGASLTAASGFLTALSPTLFWKSPVIIYPLVGILCLIWWPKRVRHYSPASSSG